MPDPPKAHRRLVPRVPKKPESQPEPRQEPPRQEPPRRPPPSSKPQPSKEALRDTTPSPRFDLDEPEDSMEMTAVRESPLHQRNHPPQRAIDDGGSLDITVQRPSAPPAEFDIIDDDSVRPVEFDIVDDDSVRAAPAELDIDDMRTSAVPSAAANDIDDDDADANETMAIPSARGSFGGPAAAPHEFPIPSYAMTAAKEAAVPRFGPTWSTLAGGSQPHEQHDPIATGSQALAPVPQVPDPDAFADLEPTALKAPVHPGDVEERPTTHISPAERGLLAAMSEGHEASRKIYMQWLERRGEKTRAEYLRVEIQLAAMNPLDIRYQETQDQLRDIAQRISVDWRSRVSRALIENCRATAGRCPAYWRALPADADDVRTCPVCKEQAFYCVTIELARGRVAAGQRVALDVTVERRPDDLAGHPHCGNCGNQLPPHTRFCPHCGRSTMY